MLGCMVDAAPDMPDAPTPRSRRRWAHPVVWVVVALLVGLFVWAVEVGSPPRIDATGVDELQVPWADPAPDEFVAEVDNPWLPLTRGTSWVQVGEVDGAATTRTTSVLDEGREVAGIDATVVRVHQRGGGQAPRERVRLYAQDRDGNVWLLGEEGVWQVGPGVPAGLAMAAEPRRGDAGVRVPLEGAAREVVRVGEGDREAVVPAGSWSDLLELTETYGSPTEAEVEVLVARGVGEVVRTWGAGNRLALERPAE